MARMQRISGSPLLGLGMPHGIWASQSSHEVSLFEHKAVTEPPPVTKISALQRLLISQPPFLVFCFGG
jgi:hypothetical protein